MTITFYYKIDMLPSKITYLDASINLIYLMDKMY